MKLKENAHFQIQLYFFHEQNNWVLGFMAQTGEMVHKVWYPAESGCLTRAENRSPGGG